MFKFVCDVFCDVLKLECVLPPYNDTDFSISRIFPRNSLATMKVCQMTQVVRT